MCRERERDELEMEKRETYREKGEGAYLTPSHLQKSYLGKLRDIESQVTV